MMKRVQVSDLNQTALRPQAKPVDAFVAPFAQDKSGSWRDLAKALSGVRPQLEQYGSQVMEADIKAQIAQAEMDRAKNEMDYATAVSQGIIPEGANPHYVKAYKQADGRYRGTYLYGNELNAAYEQSGLATQEFASPAERDSAFNSWLADHRQAALDSITDPDEYAGFQKGQNQAEQQMLSRHIQATNQANQEKTELRMQQRASEVLYLDGTPQERGEALAAMAQFNAGKFGISFETSNKVIVGAIAGEARTLALAGKYSDAYEMLGMLENVPTAPGQSLATSAPGRKAINEMAAFIEQRQKDAITWNQSQTSWNWRVQSHQFELLGRDRTVQSWAAEDATNAALADVLADPMNPELLDKWRTEAAQNPEFAKSLPSLLSYRNARMNADHVVYEAPEHVTGLRIAAQNGSLSAAKIAAEVEGGTIGVDTAAELVRTISSGSSAKGKIDALPAAHRKLIEDKLAILKRQTMGTDMIPGQGGAPVFADQMYIWTASMDEFLSSNPHPSMADLNTFTSQLISEAMAANPNIMGQAATAPDQLGKSFTQPKPEAQPQAQPQAQQFEKATPASVAKAKANPELIPAFEARFGPISSYQ